MSYKKAADILPKELLMQLQEYVVGEYIYIPQKEDERKSWGEASGTRKDMAERNRKIWSDYQTGETLTTLAEKYYLSYKSIQRILAQEKRI